MKSLTTLSTLFYFTTISKWNLWLRSVRCFTSLLLKWNLWLRSLRCFTLLLLKWNLWLRSLRCFTLLSKYFTTIRMRSLTTIATLFYFTTIKMKSLTTLTNYAVLLHNYNPRDSSTLHQVFFPQEFHNLYVPQWFHCQEVQWSLTCFTVQILAHETDIIKYLYLPFAICLCLYHFLLICFYFVFILGPIYYPSRYIAMKVLVFSVSSSTYSVYYSEKDVLHLGKF